MRINQFVAGATGLSRRQADSLVAEGRVAIGKELAKLGDSVDQNQAVFLDGKQITLNATRTIMLNKPTGYVCSRRGQGSATIYDLLPPEYHNLKPAGRLDKDSSGLLILTNDGALAQELTHPSHSKLKSYLVRLDKQLQPLHQQIINDHGVNLEDGISQLNLTKLDDSADTWQINMRQGRNRQIRRTFAALGYTVVELHRFRFGQYELGGLASGAFSPS